MQFYTCWEVFSHAYVEFFAYVAFFAHIATAHLITCPKSLIREVFPSPSRYLIFLIHWDNDCGMEERCSTPIPLTVTLPPFLLNGCPLSSIPFPKRRCNYPGSSTAKAVGELRSLKISHSL